MSQGSKASFRFLLAAAFAERGIRSLRSVLYRLADETGTSDWPSLVPKALKVINGRRNRMTGMAPSAVTADLAGEIFARLYPQLAKDRQPSAGLKPKFRIGETVRIVSRSVDGLTKRTALRNSQKKLKISKIFLHPATRFKLSELGSEEDILIGSYGEQDLVKA